MKSGFLGDIYAIRARIGTVIGEASRKELSCHRGGVFYELACHVVDQVVWLLGRPQKVTAFLRNETGVVPEFADNTLGVFEFERAMALVDTSAMETRPAARRFEVYGSRGSAIMGPVEPATHIRLCLTEAQGGYGAGETMAPVQTQTRQALYDLEFADFLETMLKAFLGQFVQADDSVLVTDEYSGYNRMNEWVTHFTINHAMAYAQGMIHTNTIEGFWSLVKRAIFGQHHHYSKHHAAAYIIEACYKYNNRNNADMFSDFIRGTVG